MKILNIGDKITFLKTLKFLEKSDVINAEEVCTITFVCEDYIQILEHPKVHITPYYYNAFIVTNEEKEKMFEPGDTVMLDLDCPLRSIFHSNNLYSFAGTKSMLYGTLPVSANKEYKIVEVYINPENDIGLILKGVNDNVKFGYLDAALFKLIHTETKEVTMAEVEEKYRR